MTDSLYTSNLPHKTEDRREQGFAAKRIFTNTEAEPCFDAADCLRFGKDLFMQHGYTTNRSGIEWLRRHVGDGFRLHPIAFQNNFSPTHTDAQLLPVRAGLILSCPERPLQPECTSLFTGEDSEWEIISAPQPNTFVMPPKCTSSPWLSMNLLNIDEDTIIVEASEKPTIRFLTEEFGFDVVPVPFRDAYKFGGSFHCQSLDVYREGAQKSYFPNLEIRREREYLRSTRSTHQYPASRNPSCLITNRYVFASLPGAEERESIIKQRHAAASSDVSESAYSCNETPCATPRNESPIGSSPPSGYSVDVYM